MTTDSQNPGAGTQASAAAAHAAHPAEARWDALISEVDLFLIERGTTAGRVLVLVPYAQLMDTGRRAWARLHPDGFAPRFESSRNWAASIQPYLPTATDLSGDMARDALVAASLLGRVVRGRLPPDLRAVMVGRLLEAARQLAPLAAARPPEERAAWAEALRPSLSPGMQTLHWESLLASVALAWASTSTYPTDVLWSPQAIPGEAFEAVLVLQGFQLDPLAEALAQRWGERAKVLMLHQPDEVLQQPQLHPCSDAEDEAQRSAACVIAHANAGRTPVALVASDRQLTRRVSAMLSGAGLSVRDETGWKLSTTHAAARLMSLLRAAQANARTDDVLDFLKQATTWTDEQVQHLERLARRVGLSHWRTFSGHPQATEAAPPDLTACLTGLQRPRALADWLTDLRRVMQLCGWWNAFNQDAAGQQLVQALRLADGAAFELQALAGGELDGDGTQDDPPDDTERPRAARGGGRMSLSTFTIWVRDVLEAASFKVAGEGVPDVVVLPMAQLLGRPFAATVAPGCDECNLPTSPDLPGQWTQAQRQGLGLPSRELVAEAGHAAWRALLAQPAVDVLWRTQEQGEAVLPSPWVRLIQGGAGCASIEPRAVRLLRAQPGTQPIPRAPDLVPQALSASAYQDLRDCPYRFFALRLLRLQESEEIDTEPDKRDMGIWLHEVLKQFHQQRLAAGSSAPTPASDLTLLDQLADSVAKAMGLSAMQGEGRAGFLPFHAAWPALRDGYLAWLAGFEAAEGRPGPRFSAAEQAMSVPVGDYCLNGKLDRIDLQDSPEGPIPFVIDYKTEPRATTTDRVKRPLEDTQIAFYAALQPHENLRAAYLSISEKRDSKGADTPTRLIEQSEVLMAREQLLHGLVHDLDRLRAGQAMPALGEGRVCDFCAARGLCRKDFRSRS